MKPKGFYFSVIFFPALILGLIFGYSLIFVGAGLLGGGLFEYFKRKQGQAPEMDEKEKKHNKIAWWIIIIFILIILVLFLIQTL